MDLQDLINGMNARMQAARAASEQLTLGELIDHLKTLPIDTIIKGLGDLDSYRGYYCDLAFSPDPEKEEPVLELLERCKAAMGEVFTGYKGGDYVMGRNTPLWISEYGECSDDMLIGIDDTGNIITRKEDEE